MSLESDDAKHDSMALDSDEAAHFNLVSAEIEAYINVADEGVHVILGAAADKARSLEVGTEKFFETGSLVRGANLTRLSLIALRTGYYSGAITLIRSIYESLLYACLFRHHPNEVINWLRLGLDDTMPQVRKIEESRRIRMLAMDAFNKMTHEQDLGSIIWVQGSKGLHLTPEAMAIDFGVDPSWLVSKDLASALEITQGDFERAVRLLNLSTSKSHQRERSRSGTKNLAEAEGQAVVYNKEKLGEMASMTTYLVLCSKSQRYIVIAVASRARASDLCADFQH